jgi:hypothetical protein
MIVTGHSDLTRTWRTRERLGRRRSRSPRKVLRSEARGGTVDAEVVDIQYIASGRRVYDVRFDVAGRICSAQVDSGSNPLPREVHIGGTSRLRYSASRPCTKVHETTSPGPGPLPIVIAVVAIGFWTGVWRLRKGPNTPMPNQRPASGPGEAR